MSQTEKSAPRLAQSLQGRLALALLVVGLPGLAWYYPHSGRSLRWPLRMLIFAGLASSLWQVWRASAKAGRLWQVVAGWSRHLEVPEGWRRHWEMMLAASVILLAGWHLGLEMRSFASASLIGDEISNIRLYSSEGPQAVISSYGLAKNHVFFNLLNSLLPGNDSLHPLRARLVSFVAVGAGWLLAIVAGWRRKRYLETGIVAGLIGINPYLLEVSLGARGYGLVFSLTLLACLALLEYVQEGRGLWLLGGAVVLATYTVPSFVIFGGTLLILLWLMTRQLAVFRCGVMTAGCILLLYFPILGQVLSVAGKYEGDYGVSYHKISDVFTTLRFSVVPEIWNASEAGLVFLPALLAAASLIGGWARQPAWKCLQIFLAASAIFVSFCLSLQTPPPRITAFLAAPIILSLALAGGLLYRSSKLAWLQPGLALAVLGGLAVVAGRSVAHYDFRPRSKWQEVAQLALNLTPVHGAVWIEAQETDLRSYVGDRLRTRSGNLPRQALAAGDLLLIENHGARKIAPLVAAPHWRLLDVTAGRGIFRRIWFPQRPEYSLLKLHFPRQMDSASLLDGNIQTGVKLVPGEGWQVDCELEETARQTARSINLWNRQNWKTVKVSAEIDPGDGQWRKLPDRRILIEDKIISCDLREMRAAKIRLTLLPREPSEVVEIFAVQESGAAPDRKTRQ